ncbi:MAG TPA: nuclear transport factor 2 family protein [Steroidobacteraceae bacterium]
MATLLIAMAACTPATNVSGAPGARLADREAIEATLDRYTRGLDRLDADLYLSSFAANGVLMIYEKRYQGRDALRDIIAEEARLRGAQKASGQAPRTLFHLEQNSTIAFTAAGQALHQAYWLTISRTGDKPEDLRLLGVGSSIDELRKIDGQWLITRREIRSQP